MVVHIDKPNVTVTVFGLLELPNDIFPNGREYYHCVSFTAFTSVFPGRVLVAFAEIGRECEFRADSLQLLEVKVPHRVDEFVDGAITLDGTAKVAFEEVLDVGVHVPALGLGGAGHRSSERHLLRLFCAVIESSLAYY